jgi:DNA repair protein RecO (recombination protein O)
MCWLSGGSINKSFFGSHTDIDGFSIGAYILQVADEISGEELPAEEVLRMTLNTLYAIDSRLKPYAQIKAAYELFAVNVSGLAPDPTACADCGCESFEGEIWLDVMNGAVVCGDCLKKRSGGLPLPETDAYEARNILVPLDAASLEAIRYVMSASPQRLFAFGLSDKRSLELFARAAETYLLNHLERDFDTLRFYKSIKDTDH